MTTPEIEEFAKILVQHVRDAAIRTNDRRLSATDVIAKRWADVASSGKPDALAEVLIPDIVDSTIAHLLGAIDQELLRLSFTASNGKSVDLTTVATEFGEMSGWYGGGAGWCETYTKERYVDYFSDLKEFFKKPLDRDEE